MTTRAARSIEVGVARSRATTDDALTGAPACTPTRVDERFDRLRRPCPACGALGVHIVYGYPSRPLVAAARRGKLVLGGCTHRPETHRCPDGHEWAAA